MGYMTYVCWRGGMPAGVNSSRYIVLNRLQVVLRDAYWQDCGLCPLLYNILYDSLTDNIQCD